MKFVWHFTALIICLLLLSQKTTTFDVFPKNTELKYDYVATIEVGSLPIATDVETVQPNEWTLIGNLILQRKTDDEIIAKFHPRKSQYANKMHSVNYRRMDKLKDPFKILLEKGVVSSIQLSKNELSWSSNMKRGIAAALQIHGDGPGAFVAIESGLNGLCNTDYYVSTVEESSLQLIVQKTPDLTSCTPISYGIHHVRSNLPETPCKKNLSLDNSVVVGVEGEYIVKYRMEDEVKQYFILNGTVKSQATVHTFEGNGESQYVSSTLRLTFIGEQKIDSVSLIEVGNLLQVPSALLYDSSDNTKTQDDKTETAINLINKLVDTLEQRDIEFNQPYDDTAAEIFRTVSMLDEKELKKLYTTFDIGTSYRQETAKNIFLEILPRIGTGASIVLIHDLVINKSVNPTTAIQLIISIPFYLMDFNMEIVKLCESFLTLGPDRPDVNNVAVLSYSTIIFKTFMANKMPVAQFDRYVKRYFDLFLDSIDYEQQILYIQALGNLQVRNVAQYLMSVIRDSKWSHDLKYLAMWATMPSAYSSRGEQSYELYWPIYENKSNPLELRVTAFTILLVSNPSPGRLLSLHRIISHETSPHLLNFYRTTVISISESTYPCHQKLKQTLAYMLRHLPNKDSKKRYWVTGNYILDYKDNTFGTAGLLQAMLIGDEQNDVPYIGYFKVASEMLGRVTGNIGIYMKARGISDSFKSVDPGINNFNINVLKNIMATMRLPTVMKTNLHFELILQIDGKTIISQYINGTTLSRLSGVHINTIFSDDSHVNMQNIRWPFMTRHTLTTALGTAIDLSIENTIVSSFRGNVSKIVNNSKQKYSSEIDIRYSTYQSLTSVAYNPVVNLDHIIRREQGTIFYLPFNNEVDIAQDMLISFVRPPNQNNGFSIKSRTVSETKGKIDFVTDFHDIIIWNGDPVLSEQLTLSLSIVDLGIKLDIISTEESIDNFKNLYSHANLQKNTAIFTDFKFSEQLLKTISQSQLNNVHFGTDKNLQFVVKNKKKSLIEIRVNYQKKNKKDDKEEEFNINLQHKEDYNKPSDYEWNFNLKTSEIENVRNKFDTIIKRTDHQINNNHAGKPNEIRACTKIIYEPLDYFIKPEIVDINLAFSFSEHDDNPTSGCSENSIKFDIKLKRDISPFTIKDLHNRSKTWDDSDCPLDILKFSPPPYDEECRKEIFNQMSTICYYELDMKYQNVPFDFIFDEYRERLSYLLTAILPDKLEKIDLTNKLHLVIHAVPDSDILVITINNRTFEYNNMLFDLDLIPDIKHETNTNDLIDYGFIQYCSVINGRLTTFNDDNIKLNSANYITQQDKRNCSQLLLADCSMENPVLAIFLDIIDENNGNTIYGLKIHAGGQFLTVYPIVGGHGVNVNDGVNCINLFDYEEPVTFPISVDQDEQFSLFMRDNLLHVIHHHVFHTSIEFNLRNTITIQTPRMSKKFLCGLCNDPVNKGSSDYYYCGHKIYDNECHDYY